MTPQQETAELDALALAIQQQALAAFETMMSNIRDGMSPREAIKQATTGFTGDYFNQLTASFNAVLNRSFAVADIKSWPIGEVELSSHLYQHTAEVAAATQHLVAEQVKGFAEIRVMALQLYEGYGFKSDPLKVKKQLPRYMRQALKDPAIGAGVRQVFARIAANRLKTPALKAAYLQALDAIEKGAGQERLKKLAKIAWYERNRYFANRIAQTELHRAYQEEQALAYMTDPSLHWVQVEMSVTHPAVDICDYFSSVDSYGQGKGIYPKAKAPRPPFHPHCRCRLVQRWDIGKEASQQASSTSARAYMASQSERNQRLIAGSRDKLQQFWDGRSLESIMNQGVPKPYQLRYVGDQVPPLLPVDLPATPLANPDPAIVQQALHDLAKEQGAVELERSLVKLQQKITNWKLQEATLGNLGKWYTKASQLLVQYPGKSLDEVAALLKQKATQATYVSDYKAAILKGKTPSAALTKAFKSLPEDEQAIITDQLKAKLANANNPTIEPAGGMATGTTLQREGVLDVAGWQKVGGQRGSNKGGTYRDGDGAEWYVKFPNDPNIAKSEVLAAKLYRLAGTEMPEIALVTNDGAIGVASRIIDGLTEDRLALAAGKVTGVADSFAADAWLANWDVVGLGFDNLKVKNGAAWRIDTGGALEYRAQGGRKGAAFGDTITEFQSLRNPSINPQAAEVFKILTEAEIKASAARVYAIPDRSIYDLVVQEAPGSIAERQALAEKLVRRKRSIEALFPEVPAKVEQLRRGEIERAKTTLLDQAKDLDLYLTEAVKGIASRAKAGMPFEQRDLDRVSSVTGRLNDLMSSVIISDNSRQYAAIRYGYWIDALTELTKGGVGSKAAWPDLGNFSSVATFLAKQALVNEAKVLIPYLPKLFGGSGINALSPAEVFKVLDDLMDDLGLSRYHTSQGAVVPYRNNANAAFFDEMPEEYVRLLWSHTTSASHRKVTEKLIEFYNEGVPLPAGVANYEEAINNALLHFAPPSMRHEGASVRGMFQGNLEEAAKYIEKMKTLAATGKPYRFETISSSTKGDRVCYGGPVVVHIKGKSGVYINSISAYPGAEDEVLFGTKTEFKVYVIEEKEGKTHIYMREL